MNGCRKSDKFVVPKKSSNKPNNMGAEKMEGRDLPKENKQATKHAPDTAPGKCAQ